MISGATAAAELRKASDTSLQFLNIFLLTFAVVALVVGSFVIYNTFTITVAHRSRETALLRAIGAQRKQVKRSIMLEALVTGLVASVAGVVLGIATAHALRSLLSRCGLELPADALVVHSSTIVASIVTGVIVTVLAGFMPARRAAKVAPIEALRDVALDRTARSRRRAVIGTVVISLGASSIMNGLAGAGIAAVGGGAFMVFAGVAVLGPVLAGPLTRLIGRPVAITRGVAGRLACDNATRNPRRTSASASALMIGIGLVVLITVLAASMKASIARSIDTAMTGDYVVTTQFGMGGLSPEVAHRIDALPETAAVTEFRGTTAAVAGQPVMLTAFDPSTVERNVRLDVHSGSVRHMGVHDIAVQAKTAKQNHIAVGDTIAVFFAQTGQQRLHVVAVYGVNQPLGPYSMSIAGLDVNVVSHLDADIAVTDAPGYSAAQVRHAIERVVAAYPSAKLYDKQQFEGSIANQINQAMNLVYVLLAMALVIALFGITNTLALSVFERTREIGLVRAIGMSRAQVRSSVRWESVLVALLGTTLGAAIGLGFAWALVSAMHGKGITEFAIPGLRLVEIALAAAIAAVGAAALPAARAARLDVLDAVAE